jgi:hypothetical protein
MQGMRLSMLGESFPYAFAPAGMGASYRRANGSGYINGTLGGDTPAQLAAQAWMSEPSHIGKTPSSATDYAFSNWVDSYNTFTSGTKVTAGEVYSAIKSYTTGAKVAQFSTGVQTIMDSALKGLTTVADAIAKIKASGAPPQEQQAAIGKLQFQQMLPWIIGGGAVLVGLFLVMGTRRRTVPTYASGRGSYRY